MKAIASSWKENSSRRVPSIPELLAEGSERVAAGSFLVRLLALPYAGT
jgi:hypothetical protein